MGIGKPRRKVGCYSVHVLEDFARTVLFMCIWHTVFGVSPDCLGSDVYLRKYL